MKNVSVVVCVLNEEKYVGRCLERLSHQTIPRKEYEIIVVDGKSADRTVAIAKKYADAVLVGEYNPLGKARQAGLLRAKSKVVAFTDADTEVPADWLETYLGGINGEVVGASGPVSALEAGATLSTRFGMNVISWTVKALSITRVGGLYGPNFAVAREPALRVGGFRSIQSEDCDLAYRLVKAGRLVYVDRNRVRTSARRLKAWGIPKLFFLAIVSNLQIIFGGVPSFDWSRVG